MSDVFNIIFGMLPYLVVGILLVRVVIQDDVVRQQVDLLMAAVILLAVIADKS